MGFGVRNGQEITPCIDGTDEGEALAAIKELFSSNFGE
jgi:phosphotransferase system HPr-like phosphotransfer protein